MLTKDLFYQLQGFLAKAQISARSKAENLVCGVIFVTKKIIMSFSKYSP